MAVSATGRSDSVGIKLSGFIPPGSCVKPNGALKNVVDGASRYPDDSLLEVLIGMNSEFCWN